MFLPTKLPEIAGAHQLPGGIQILGADGAEIGDKARTLALHAEAAMSAGFALPPRIVVAEDRLDTIFSHNGLSSSLREYRDYRLETYKLNLPGALEGELAAISQTIRDTCGNVPVAVRSSAKGDARGTGVYRSECVQNTPRSLRYGILQVLASYLGDSARVWRRTAGVPDGLGIMIEPLVCQPIPDPEVLRMAPLISGMAYSSSGIGPGFIKISYGLGGGGSERLTREKLAEHGFKAQNYFDQFAGESVLVDSVSLSEDPGKQYPLSGVAKSALRPLLAGVDYAPLFQSMADLEEALGSAVYTEWALHTDGGRQRHYLVQLALVEHQSEKWEFGDTTSTLFKMDDVRHGSPLEIGAIVFIDSIHQLENLASFNAANSKYLLIYGDALMGSVGLQRECPMTMRHISNAAALMLAPGSRATAYDWEEHLRGLTEKVKIMVGKGNQVKNLWNGLRHFDHEHGLLVYRRPMRIQYSSSEGAAIVTPRET